MESLPKRAEQVNLCPIDVAISLDANDVAVKCIKIFVKLGWPTESNVRVAVVSFEGGGVEHGRMSKVYFRNKYPSQTS
jgi:hypothetical protein